MSELLTVKEISQRLKCNVNYVHKLRKAELLPFVKLGCYKCRAEAVTAFIMALEAGEVDVNGIV